MMRWIPFFSSVAVGSVLVAAGAVKLADRPSWEAEADGMGVPRWLLPVVPGFEVILGALLVAQIARRMLSIVAVVTFAAFTVALVRVLADGRRPVCACFGAWSRRPIGARDIVRNVVLIALSMVGTF